MLRHPLVHERVVGGDEVEQAPIVANEAVEEQLGLTAKAGSEPIIVLRVLQVVGADLVQIL